MGQLILRRLGFAILSLFAVTAIVFAATEILPGDAALNSLGREATDEAIAARRELMGLDQTMIFRYAFWLTRIFHGDLGVSLATQQPVWSIVEPRLWNSVLLAGYAGVIAITLALLLGLICSAYSGSKLDRVISTGSMVLVAIPDYVIAVALVSIFAVHWQLFPSLVYRPDWSNLATAAYQLFLPMLTLVAAILTHVIRMLRAAILDVLASDYVEMAVLKGTRKWPIILQHAMPNALGPVLSVIALALGYLFSSVVIVEVIFSYPGLGRLMIDAISSRDIPLIQVTIGIFCTIYIAFNALADLALVMLSPRTAGRAS